MPGEAEHYKKLFANCDVAGFEYASVTPWDFKDEFLNWAKEKFGAYKSVILVANSIGAYFLMNAVSQTNAETGGKQKENHRENHQGVFHLSDCGHGKTDLQHDGLGRHNGSSA